MSFIRPCLIGMLVVVSGAALTGCATTVDDRIRADRERFERFPPEVQENIRAERIDLGYTTDMVRMALGDPNRVRTRVTEEASEEVWIYTAARPGFSVGVGVGRTTGRRSGVGTGVGVGTGGHREEALRVIFREDVVHAIEEPRRE